MCSCRDWIISTIYYEFENGLNLRFSSIFHLLSAITAAHASSELPTCVDDCVNVNWLQYQLFMLVRSRRTSQCCGVKCENKRVRYASRSGWMVGPLGV